MPDKLEQEVDHEVTTQQRDQPVIYQLRIEGHLSPHWAEWFEGLTITLEENGDTLLTGPVMDQAVLHGLLKKVRDVGMPLLSVTRVQADRADTSEDTTGSVKI